jgi:hypothetical protein
VSGSRIRGESVYRILLPLLVAAGAACPSCESRRGEQTVTFDDRAIVFANGNAAEYSRSGMLIVGLGENRKVSINRFETGSVEQLGPFAEKLRVIFTDRQRSGVKSREVIIELRGAVRSPDLEKLIEALTESGADPIRIVRQEGERP